MKRGVKFYKGLKTDFSADTTQKGIYIDALDIRITTDVGESQGSVTNIKGNKSYFSLPTTDTDIGITGTMKIIGATSIRDTIVFFTADDSDTRGWVFKLEYSEIDQTLVAGDPKIIYKSNELYFSKKRPIEALGRFEGEPIQRVYWTDYFNYFRSINIVDPALDTYATYPDVSVIDAFPSITYTQPLLTNISSSGALVRGQYQYAYRLITADGKRTMISPPGNLIHIVSDSDIEFNTRAYTGDKILNSQGDPENASKATEITIDTQQYQNVYTEIELICSILTSYTGVPEIFSIETKAISLNSPNTVFIHTGAETTIEELTLDEFTIKTLPFKTPKTLAPKDSSLVVANIRGAMFSVQDILAEGETFDAKTGRYDSSGNLPTSDALKNAFNVETAAGHPGYNQDAHWDENWHNHSQHKYQNPLLNNGELRLGGNGPNISYTFDIRRFLVDNEPTAAFARLNHENNEPINLYDGYGNYANTTWDSFASPFHSGLLRGYKRGETYRFGIVFYDKKGNASFVEYIGDIKFPDISEEDSVTNESGTKYFPLSKEVGNFGDINTSNPEDGINTNSDFLAGYVNTFAYALGIKFTINLPPSLQNQITSYQIVRLKRESTDAKRICTGIMKPAMKFSVAAPDVGGGSFEEEASYDLRGPQKSENIVHLFSEHKTTDANGDPTIWNNSLLPPLWDRQINHAYGKSGNFNTLNNQKIRSVPFPCLGAFINFSSADLSYKTPEVMEAINSGACLLMTGRYGNYYSSLEYPSNWPGRDDDTYYIWTGGLTGKPPIGLPNFAPGLGLLPWCPSGIFGGPVGMPNPHHLENGEEYFENCRSRDPMFNRKKAYDIHQWYDSATYGNATDREDLGNDTRDRRRKLRTVGQVDKTTTKKAIEYIKYIKDLKLINYTDGRQDNDGSLGVANKDLNGNLGPFNGFDDSNTNQTYYFRNFYAYLGVGPLDINGNATGSNISLNNHLDGAGGQTGVMTNNGLIGWPHNSAFYKGASGAMATLTYIDSDPLTGASITWGTHSPFHYFRTWDGSDTPACQPLNIEGGDVNVYGPINRPLRIEMESSTPILDILMPRAEVYSGFTQTALEDNVFMPASPVIKKVNLAPTIFGGDIFLNMWTFQEGTTWNNENFYNKAKLWQLGWLQEWRAQGFMRNESSTICMVTESRVNIALAYGSTTKTHVEKDVSGGPSGYTKEMWRQENDNTVTTWGKTKHMYKNSYEFTYSAEANTIAYVIKPDEFSSGNVNDIRAYISQEKINEEIIDSWNIFGINDYIDVEDHGPINRIINWKDNVYYFQNTGVGRYSINPRAVTSTEDGVPTELGSAKGLQDFIYISNNFGSIHQWAVADTDTGIYSFDGIHKKIFRINQSNAPLSEIKGIHGLLKNLSGDFLLFKDIDNKDGSGGDNPIMNRGVHIAKDKINNEVIFTFLGTFESTPLNYNTSYTIGQYVVYNGIYYLITTSYTSGDSTNMGDKELLDELIRMSDQVIAPNNTLSIVYDEVADEFSTRFSATPTIYLENGNILLSGDNNPAIDSTTGMPIDNNDKVYQHNVGNWGEFYGVQKEMSIKLILNENADFNKVLRTIEFNSIVRNDDKVIDREQTITAFQVETEYQNTGKIPFSSNRIKRRFDKWRMKIPRDVNNLEGGVAKDRLRSTYFTLTLYFDNSYNKELILDRILYYYDVQMF